MRRLLGLLLAFVLVGSSCSTFGSERFEGKVMTASFARAVQVFPGNSVRVMGVDVGRVTAVENVDGAAQVTFRIEDPDVKLPADVEATLVPVSLLGERYIQLFPAYEEGDAEYTASDIPLERTSVPAEQDELLRGLQDYFGALDPDKVADFVTNAAAILEGRGDSINELIDSGSSAINVLASKRDSLAGLITELDDLTTTLATRQDAIAQLIRTYNVVTSTLNDNRAALEGTIAGLNEAATEMAALLIQYRDPLDADVKSLTRTMRTLSRNAKTFAKTGKWAVRLFDSARRAVDYDEDWLRLSNQGRPLFEMIAHRLEDRLKGVCLRLEVEECSTSSYWKQQVPDLFCLDEGGCKSDGTIGDAVEKALDALPKDADKKLKKRLKKRCRDAANPERCLKKQKKKEKGKSVDELIGDILDDLDSTTDGLGLGIGDGL